MKKTLILTIAILSSGCGLSVKEQGLADLKKYHDACEAFVKTDRGVQLFKNIAPHIVMKSVKTKACEDTLKRQISIIESMEDEKEVLEEMKRVEKDLNRMGRGFFIALTDS
ncbi:MAG: hypothetical protein RPS47_12700 [Colwellia sp.]|jgi:hypothetical protein